jgi:hypothetical protein
VTGKWKGALAGTTERTPAPGAFICMKGEPVTHWMGSIDVLGIESPRTFGD